MLFIFNLPLEVKNFFNIASNYSLVENVKWKFTIIFEPEVPDLYHL
jgi:hypothetical protein